MSLFQEMEGDVAVLVQNGIYYQQPLYRRGDFLYAKFGGGFVRLMADGGTSRPKMRFDFVDVAHAAMGKDGLGRLGVIDRDASPFKPLDFKDQARITNGATKP